MGFGEDDDGKKMLDGFREDGIDTDRVAVIPGVPTGTALIFVDRNGENCIAVAPGANDFLSKEPVTLFSLMPMIGLSFEF